jgi:hypothetical protein
MVGLICALMLAACGESLPGGTYTSSAYHFRVSFPAGWQATAASGDAATIPLVVTFTRSSAHTSGAPMVSTLTVTVLNLSDRYLFGAAAKLAHDPRLQRTTLSGLPAYASPPDQQAIPGAMGTPSALTDTHTDYYLVHGGYEYQLSTDAVSGDNADADLQSMLQSFALTA